MKTNSLTEIVIITTMILTAVGIIFITVILAVMVSSTLCNASTTEIGMILKSKHFNNKDLNENNRGIYIIKNDIIAAVFKNSYNNTTCFLGYSSNLYENSVIQLTISYGAVYGYGWDGKGYTSRNADILPYLSPTLSILIGKIKLNTHYTADGLAWSIGYSFR